MCVAAKMSWLKTNWPALLSTGLERRAQLVLEPRPFLGSVLGLAASMAQHMRRLVQRTDQPTGYCLSDDCNAETEA